MTTHPAQPSARPTDRSTRIAWGVAALLVLVLAAWPLGAGMIVANDDIKFVRGDAATGTVGERIADAWRTNSNFRPLDVAVGAWCDPLTLACGTAIAVQLAGLAALLAGAVALARRALPGHPAAPPLVACWIALSPSTTVSLWQMDTCSQTWAAAAACWAGILAWDAIDAAGAGRRIGGRLLALGAIFAAGCTIKEIFYGWSFGIGLACGIAALAAWRRSRPAAVRTAWLALPVIALPILHLAVRWKASALGSVAAQGVQGTRYKLEVGQNVVMNSLLSMGALLSNGPLHLIPDDAAPIALRALPFVALLASVCLAGTALGFLAHHRRSVPGIRWRAVFLCAFAGVASLAITLPMGSVSDLYGLGANVGTGILAAACATSLWHPVADDERLLGRGIAVLACGVLAIAGAYGLASRAYHFGVTWRTAGLANEALLALQAGLPADPSRRTTPIFFSDECYQQTWYGQVVVSPIQSIDLDDTLPWMNRRDPSRALSCDPGILPAGDTDPRTVVRCTAFPARAHR